MSADQFFGKAGAEKVAVALPPPAAPRVSASQSGAAQDNARSAAEVTEKAQLALRERELSKRDPRPVHAATRLAKNMTVSSALTTCIGSFIGTYVLPDASVALIGAASFLASFGLIGIGRWIGDAVLGPMSVEIKCETGLWFKSWRIRKAQSDGILTERAAVTRRLQLLDDSLKEAC